jgi:hypothetical protein
MAALTYTSLQHEARKRVLRYTFVQGHGGPLVFVWTVGIGLFLIIWTYPTYAVLWTVAVAVLAGLIIRDYRRSPTVMARVSRSFLEARFPVQHLTNAHHRDALNNGMNLFLEVLRKLGEMERSGSLDEALTETVADMDRLLVLQYESAQQAEELERLLHLIGAEPGGGTSGGRKAAATDEGPDDLRRHNLEAAWHEVDEANRLVDLIGQHLETIMLQVFRIDRQPLDVLGAVSVRRGSSEMLERLQHIVDARRSAADQLIEWMAPPAASDLRPDQVVATETPKLTPETSARTTTPTATSGEMADTLGDEFVHQVEEALRRLRNPAGLATARLVFQLPHTLNAHRTATGDPRLAEATPLEQAQALRELLIAAVQRLQPSGPRSNGQPSVLQHDIVCEEYLLGMSTKQILVRHSISESTLHRQRREAIRILARELHRQEQLLAGHAANGHVVTPAAT